MNPDDSWNRWDYITVTLRTVQVVLILVMLGLCWVLWPNATLLALRFLLLVLNAVMELS